jgi:hypothetical protein
MASLAEILAEKRRLAARGPIDFTSTDPLPTVDLFIKLFNLNPRVCYIDYMDGLKWLVFWLGKPDSVDCAREIPFSCDSYTIREIAKCLDANAYSVWRVALRNAGI